MRSVVLWVAADISDEPAAHIFKGRLPPTRLTTRCLTTDIKIANIHLEKVAVFKYLVKLSL
jgi:hypothetical protein